MSGASPTTPIPAASVVAGTQAPAAATVTAPFPKPKPSNPPAAPTTELKPIAGSYLFAEGPAADWQGNVYFSDINAGKIYKWSPDGQVSVFVSGLKGPNGLAFEKNGLLIACEGGSGRLIWINAQTQVQVLVDQYQGLRF